MEKAQNVVLPKVAADVSAQNQHSGPREIEVALEAGGDAARAVAQFYEAKLHDLEEQLEAGQSSVSTEEDTVTDSPHSVLRQARELLAGWDKLSADEQQLQGDDWTWDSTYFLRVLAEQYEGVLEQQETLRQALRDSWDDYTNAIDEHTSEEVRKEARHRMLHRFLDFQDEGWLVSNPASRPPADATPFDKPKMQQVGESLPASERESDERMSELDVPAAEAGWSGAPNQDRDPASRPSDG